MTSLVDYRSQFNSLRNCRYLISNSLGAMPNRARDYAMEYIDTWAERGVRAWSEQWMAQLRRVGDKIGALINAADDTVAMHPNVTSAEAVVLSCFDWEGPRNKVVMVDMEFPSIQYLYREWLQGKGRIEVIPSTDGIRIPTDRVIQAIDDTTMLVPISHVLFRSAYIMDAAAIIEKAHEFGAMVVLDIFQSIGTVPIDVQELNVDFAVGGCLKWLCGGPGACFLYVRPDLQPHLKPRFTGWMAHENPFAFEAPPIQRRLGSARFLNGTPVIPALYTCQAGLDIIAEVGISAIRKRSQEMTARLLNMADQRGWPTTTPKDPEHRGGTVAIAIPDAAAIAAELNERHFLVDYRPQAGIRIAPHFYNTDAEIDGVIAEIEAIVGEEAHRKHLAVR